MKFFLFFPSILLTLSLTAETFCVDTNHSKNLDILTQVFLKTNPSLSNFGKPLAKKKVKRDLVFSEAYIKSLTPEQKKELELNLLDIIANFHLKQYLSGFNINEEDKVLRSYYVSHKENFSTPATIDIHKIEFSESKVANDFKNAFVKSPQDALKTFQTQYEITSYSRIPKQNLSDYYRLILEGLQPFQTSRLIPDKGKSVLFYYDNPIEEGVLPFEVVREKIRETLLEKKRRDIIDTYYDELTSTGS